MKKILMIIALFLGSVSIVSAQTEPTKTEVKKETKKMKHMTKKEKKAAAMKEAKMEETPKLSK